MGMLHEIYNDFIQKFNIRNGELASQKKLNSSVNVLKKEVDDLFNRSEIIRGENAFDWQSRTYYSSGEIVYYQNKNWMVIEDQESYNELPGTSYKWVETRRADWTMELDPYGYIHINSTIPYTPTGDYNPSTKFYTDTVHRAFSLNMNIPDGINFLPLTHNSLTNIEHITGNGVPTTDVNYIPPYEPSAYSHPATKGYVDDQLEELASGGSITIGNTLNSEALGLRPAEAYVTLERKFSGDYNGFAVKNGSLFESINATDWMRTTANGILPYDQTAGSNLGSVDWKFKQIWCKTNNADVYNTTNADLAEKYSSDKDYTPGTILCIGTDTEVSIYTRGSKLAGVVSTEPGYVLNSSSDGIVIALKGRVPCNIIGSAKRGDYINAFDDGLGIASDEKSDLTIGVCVTGGTNIVEVKI